MQCPKCDSLNTKPKDFKYLCKCGHLFVNYGDHPHQVKALTSKKRFILILSGVQGGKSEVGAKWIKDEIMNSWNDEGDFLVAAPTYKCLAQSTLDKALEQLNTNRLGKFHKQDMIYLLKNGHKVFLRSTEDPNSLEAMTLRAAWLDEAGQMKKQVWTNLRHGRTSILQGRIFLTTTPYPDYWWPVNEIINPWKQGDEEFEVIQFPSTANPSFPRKEVERAQKTLDSRIFQMRYGGQYVKMGGLIYPDFGTQNIAECPDQSKIITWIGGIDWGHNFCFVLIGRDKNGTYWQVKELYTQGGLLKEHAKTIKEICKGKNLFAIYYDPSEPGLAQELTVLGITPLVPGNNDVELGINRVGQLIKARRFKVSKSCPNTISELESYHRKEKDEGETKIVKVKDHAVDSLRYTLLSYPDEELVVPEEEKKPWEYRSEIERRREEGLKRIKEKMAIRERGLVTDSVLGDNW